MDKNIAALLREDARTIHVVFNMDDAMENHLDVDFDWPKGADKNVVAEAKRKIMEGNSPAFRIRPGAKTWTYVTDNPAVAVGDTVIVDAEGKIKLVKVVKVDAEAKIEPNSDIVYKWIIGRVDMDAYQATLKRNADLEALVAEASRNHMRRSFRQVVLDSLENGTRDKVLALVSSTSAIKRVRKPRVRV